MAALENKIDFAVVFASNNANPNGDPLNGNRPRTTSEGLGEVSDVALKGRFAIACKMLVKRFSCSPMTVPMTAQNHCRTVSTHI